ncbi:MAG: MFS transporter [Sphingobium sp.]
MTNGGQFGSTPRPLMFCSALGLVIWTGATWGWEIWHKGGNSLADFLFRTQDLPALVMGMLGLILCVPFVIAHQQTPVKDGSWALNPRIILPAILGFALIAWVGGYFLFHDYALSRDEEVAEMAAAYMHHGMIGWPIPARWEEYRRAIMPEFFLPYGANHVWASAYLPLNSAFRAFCGWLGDANLSAPILLVIGLAALWRVAVRLFPDRSDAVAVVMVLAGTSMQLLVTGMTAFAMTGHFAFNMLWLACVLRDSRWSHVGAGGVALLAAGLHQWHFPLLFLLPFMPWFALQRRWAVLAFHLAVLALMVILWGKLWPAYLLQHLGPPADVLPAAGVADKLGSLFARLDSWHPLLQMSRFVAWNNLLLVPLALVAAVTMPWRVALRGETIVLPLALGAIAVSVLAMDQGYGWGYRYLHGFIGSLALLAGYGWVRLGHHSLRPVMAAALIALLTGTFLAKRAQDYVLPYAKSYRAITQSRFDVVLVDPRGGWFVTDVVRGKNGNPLGHPVVMNIDQLSVGALDRLCDRYSIGVFDQSAFLPLGIGALRWGDSYIATLRAHMVERGCGRIIVTAR